MALTTSGIAQVREIHSKIAEAEYTLTDLRGVLDFMNSNAEFSNFVSGTSFGRDYYEKWGKMLNLISGELVEAVVSMNNATQRFLEQQENNNNRTVSGTPIHSNSMYVGNVSESKQPIINASSGNITGFHTEPIYETPGFRPVYETTLK